jgi:hypothetical protein
MSNFRLLEVPKRLVTEDSPKTSTCIPLKNPRHCFDLLLDILLNLPEKF